MRQALFAFAFVLALGSIAGAATTIGAILASPATYDGQHVSVTGTVQNLEEKTSHKGNPYDVFSLCSDHCIHVFTFGRPNISDGKMLKVSGIFSATKHVGQYTFHNEIEADENSL